MEEEKLNIPFKYTHISLLDFLKQNGNIYIDGENMYYTFPNLICREEKGELICIENDLKNV